MERGSAAHPNHTVVQRVPDGVEVLQVHRLSAICLTVWAVFGPHTGLFALEDRSHAGADANKRMSAIFLITNAAARCRLTARLLGGAQLEHVLCYCYLMHSRRVLLMAKLLRQ